MKKIFLLGALMACLHVPAAFAGGVALLTPIGIDPQARIPDAVRQECRIDFSTQNNVFEGLRRHDPNVVMTSDPSSGRVLKVTILEVRAEPGGAWSGYKAITARLEMLEDGKVVYTARMYRQNNPFAGGYRGNCSLLDAAAKGLGKGAAKWAQHPTTLLTDPDEPGSEAPVASAPARAASEPASAAPL
jgi:hypothetical protein